MPSFTRIGHHCTGNRINTFMDNLLGTAKSDLLPGNSAFVPYSPGKGWFSGGGKRFGNRRCIREGWSVGPTSWNYD